MTEAKSNRFTKYFPMLLDALRSVDPKSMRPSEAVAWIRVRVNVEETDLARTVANGRQSIFENDIHWTRFYLNKAGLVGSPKRGLWSLTPEGRDTKLTPGETWALYVRIRDAIRPGLSKNDEDLPAPDDAEGEDESSRSYWFVGAALDGKDQTPRFIKAGIWENGYKDVFANLVRRMKPGDRIILRKTFNQKHGLPFNNGGVNVCTMRIINTGMILANRNDGNGVTVAWDPPFQPRDWYFYTYIRPVVEAASETDYVKFLLDFIFRDISQDYKWWLAQPYWANLYGILPDSPPAILAQSPSMSDALIEDPIEIEQKPSYTIDEMIDEGCFLPIKRLENIIERWRSKKNLILQGPPGTGKTWLAKRLGYALLGSKDGEIARLRLRVVQFHPSLAYEDFVRGWRPNGDGRLDLADGIMMQAIEAALSEPDRPFVLVVEEINRGNPAQIFGEMLTLLENTKRRAAEALELAYRKKPNERVYVPENLYVIGTMNVADRSLAIVDLALRRRFAFVELEPCFGPAWQRWCSDRGIDESTCLTIKARMDELNAEITASVSLGPHYRVGHSFVTPDIEESIPDIPAWFRGKVENEIGPLLDEYWYDTPDVAHKARSKLLSGFD